MNSNRKCLHARTNVMAILYLNLITLIFLSLFLSSCSKDPDPQPVQEPNLSELLQNTLDEGLIKYKGKGASAAIILPDGKLWLGTSGISHGSVPISVNMPFGAGSITKNFTAVVILKLAEEGKLNLDDSLYTWLRSYPNVDSTITIRQLLNHTSGLNDFADNREFWISVFQDPSKIWNPEDIVTTFNLEPVFPKGVDWNYSSTGYILLRMIIEDITESDIRTVYEDLCFIPYGLSNSFTSKGETLPEGIAHGWFDLDFDGDYDDSFHWPRTAFASGVCGEVFSTAEDLAKWAQAIYKNKTVLSAESLEQMLTFHSPCTGEEFFCDGYGLGAFKSNPDLLSGIQAIGHTGNAPAYAAASLFVPELDLSIGFVDNTEDGESMFIMNDLLKIVKDHIEKHR